ncbi:MAG TPA: quinolinate synthase NadA [Chitinispirillaceae bacterium]|jgi:quinolinate synthase|nr:quinolinate synthase NadA [Chitinispirillaceae bacterium]
MNSLQKEISELKSEKCAVILSHTYQPAEVQDIADFVGDSYGLSVEASRTNADVIVFCGVRFMAETASILNPGKKVILAEKNAGCPMADMIDASDLRELKAQYPDYLVMCYVNSTAEVKAESDVCCTSSNAVRIAGKLPEEKGIIFVPDKHLGSFVQEKTGRKMVFWDGFCPTHQWITREMILQARAEYPDAVLLIHPEASAECRNLCDHVLSTGEMCSYVKSSSHKRFIIATESGLLHTLRKANPEKEFMVLSEKLICPNMKKGSLLSVKKALDGSGGEVITVPEKIAVRASLSLKRMLEMSV